MFLLTYINNQHKMKNELTLKGLQKRVFDFCEQYGWNDDSVELKWLLLTEEIGELAKEIRNHRHIYIEKGKTDTNNKQKLAHEFADVLSFIADIANKLDIDLEEAFLEKEAINKTRSWN